MSMTPSPRSIVRKLHCGENAVQKEKVLLVLFFPNFDLLGPQFFFIWRFIF
jgi:hypothetical protein